MSEKDERLKEIIFKISNFLLGLEAKNMEIDKSKENMDRLHKAQDFMIRQFEDNKENFIEIKIPGYVFEKIMDFSKDVANFKKTEGHKQYTDKDSIYIINNFLVGVCCEYATLRWLDKEYLLDLGVGRVKDFNFADLRFADLDIGVKASKIGNAPLVYKNPVRPEIICTCKPSFTKNESGVWEISKIESVYICGLATIETLKRYQDINFLIDKDSKQATYKSGFYGYSHLTYPQELKKQLMR